MSTRVSTREYVLDMYSCVLARVLARTNACVLETVYLCVLDVYLPLRPPLVAPRKARVGVIATNRSSVGENALVKKSTFFKYMLSTRQVHHPQYMIQVQGKYMCKYNTSSTYRVLIKYTQVHAQYFEIKDPSF